MREVNKHFHERKKENQSGGFCLCVLRVREKKVMSRETGKAADKQKS